MRKFVLGLIVLCLALPARGGPVLPDSLFLTGLEAAGLRPGELSCYPESNDRDPFRLPIVQSIMEQPARADSLLPALLDALFALPPEDDPLGAPDLAFLTRLDPWLHGELSERTAFPWESARIDLLQALGEEPPHPETFFGALLPFLAKQRLTALADLDAEELDFLLRQSSRLLDEDLDTESIDDPIALRRAEATQSALTDSTLALWARVDRARLFRLGYRFIRDSVWYAQIALLERYGEQPPLAERFHEFTDGSRAEGTLIHVAETAFGNVVVGGEGANRYRGNFLFILELGGDDDYRLEGQSALTPDYLSAARDGNHLVPGRGFRCLVDFGGDDRWRGEGDFALAGGLLGCGLLVDHDGDDVYQALNFDLGCGWLGTGLLVDRAGSDLYAGGTAVMGAGGGGLGLLRDEAGDDVYRGELYAQGFAWVGGCGVLEDRAGGDVYAVAPTVTDILRYEDHSLTLSQGFSIGARPHYSGGIGILRDGGGNDSYLADIYGQGAAYWYALGLLQDLGGNDRYDAYQYAQGAGIHLALGYLLDEGGNDSYSSHGVGQGCGHDLAFGLLLDAAGNDRYSCDDLSQGAGSANGIGVLLDGAGLDGYLSKSATAPAYGNPRRHFGSVGLLVDGSGEDWFSAKGEPPPNNERHGSLEGTLLDRDVPLAGPVWDPGEAVPFRAAAWTMNDYFLMASSGEPRFRDWQQAGMDSLVAHPDAAIPALIPHFDTDVARQRHRIKDALKAIGTPAVGPLRRVLREGPPRYRRQAAWCLEHIADPAAFPELIALLAEARDHRDAVAAMAALARLEELGRVERRVLLETCEQLARDPESHPLLRKEIAYLLGHQALGSSALLVELAGDPHYAPRWMARRALAGRANWGQALARAWRAALVETESLPARHLSALLPLRPAREVTLRLREARKSRHVDCAQLRSDLSRALRAHPDREGRKLAASLARLQGSR